MPHQYIGLVVFLPLAGFLVNGLLGRKFKSELVTGIIGSSTVGIGFVLSALTFFELAGSPQDSRTVIVELFPWISAGSLHVSFAYQIDQLSILMTLVVTGVGFLIHVYSIGYMHGDPGFWRFFAYLNLFIFAMLNLVLADNFLLLFLGWEGVGLCSYLLIGFWYDRRFEKGTTGDAAKKAFIVNRIGDFGFLIGMFLVAQTFGSLNFQTVFLQASGLQVGEPVMFWIAMALFLGATGKSAQIPLFVWLPDAMAGPTPVSALIHAATMVTAGIYMVARCSVIYALAPAAMEVVAVIGASTALFAASIGLVQNDIKKVLAYSTISQLGYMFLALGVGAFAAGIFHVVTHAFFKALLFLGSGAVIHALHDEQDIRTMGGLKTHLPTTYRTFVIGAIAIAGIPPLSGFVSKDEILWKAFSHGQPVLWLMGLVGAGLTAFYMFRLVSLTFEGQHRWDSSKHPHEAPGSMTIPLIILAFLSVVGGVIGLPESLGGTNLLEHWLEPVFSRAQDKLMLPGETHGTTENLLMALSVVVSAGGILLARSWYLKHHEKPERLSASLPRAYNVLLHKYYVDEMYHAVIVNPLHKISEKFLWTFVDIWVIDRIVNGSAHLMQSLGKRGRMVQTGVAQNYVLVFVFGVVAIIAVLILK